MTCTVLTCEPNKSVGEIYYRMPVILSEADWPKWLGEEPSSEEELLLSGRRPCPDDVLKIWPVDNKAERRSTGPNLVRPIDPQDEQAPTLF